MENNRLSLNQRLSLIGFRIGYKDENIAINQFSLFDYDIEETLILACYESENDFRLLSLIATWISLHGEYVIVEKFFKKLNSFEKFRGKRPTVINLIAAQAVTSGHSKWKKWITSSKKNPEYPVKQSILESSIEYQGANSDLEIYGVLVPNKFLRIREADILPTEELVKSNKQFRNRLIYGSSWRSDIIAAIENGIENPSKIAKILGCSYEPSYRIFKEFNLAKSAS